MKRKSLLILLLSLSIMAGAGLIYNNNVYAATLGQQVVQPEEGWKRFSGPSKGISDISFVEHSFDKELYGGAVNHNDSYAVGRNIKFTFYGTKLRLYYGSNAYNPDDKVENIEGIISFDNGATWERIEDNLVCNSKYNTMFYEKEGLTPEMHDVFIKIINNNKFKFNGFDTDEDGEVFNSSDLRLQKNKLDMVKNDNEKIVIECASLRSSGDKCVFTSSDESVATVDKNGYVKAVGKGTATIKVEFPGTKKIRLCKVNVTNIPRVENGWKRIMGNNSEIYNIEFCERHLDEDSYGGNISFIKDKSWGRDIFFAFYGTKLRLYFDDIVSEEAEGVISFDNGETWEKFDPHTQDNTMVYEKDDLDLEYHEVQIKVFYDKKFSFECFDIDDDGELLKYNLIRIGKTKLNLIVNQEEKLTLPTVNWGKKIDEILWSSSDESVATVDKKGVVTAVGAGQAKITATVEGRKGWVKVCTVTVTEPEEIVEEKEVPSIDEPATTEEKKDTISDNSELEIKLDDKKDKNIKLSDETIESLKSENLKEGVPGKEMDKELLSCVFTNPTDFVNDKDTNN